MFRQQFCKIIAKLLGSVQDMYGGMGMVDDGRSEAPKPRSHCMLYVSRSYKYTPLADRNANCGRYLPSPSEFPARGSTFI